MRHSVTFQIALSQAARQARAAGNADGGRTNAGGVASAGSFQRHHFYFLDESGRGLYARWAPVTRQMVAA